MKSVREVEEFIIHPNRIKRIEQGEALVISRTVDTCFGLVGIPRARSFDQSIMQRAMIESELKKTRHSYIHKAYPGLTSKLGEVAQNDKKKGKVWD